MISLLKCSQLLALLDCRPVRDLMVPFLGEDLHGLLKSSPASVLAHLEIALDELSSSTRKLKDAVR